QPHCRGQRAPVGDVEVVAVYIVADLTRAADAGNERHVVRLEAFVDQGPLQRRQNREVATARAPPRLGIGLEISKRRHASIPPRPWPQSRWAGTACRCTLRGLQRGSYRGWKREPPARRLRAT